MLQKLAVRWERKKLLSKATIKADRKDLNYIRTNSPFLEIYFPLNPNTLTSRVLETGKKGRARKSNSQMQLHADIQLKVSIECNLTQASHLYPPMLPIPFKASTYS